MLNNNLISKLQIWGIEDDIVLFKDGSFGSSFKISPLDISCAADSAINQIRQKLKTFLNALPKNIDVQFMQSIEKSDAKDFTLPKDHIKNTVLFANELSKQRENKFNTLNARGLLPEQENTFLVRAQLPKELLPKNNIFSYFKDKSEILQISEDNFNKALRWAKNLNQEIESNLMATGLEIKRISVDEVVKCTFDVWNPNHPVGIGTYDLTDLRNNILCSELVKNNWKIRRFRLIL